MFIRFISVFKQGFKSDSDMQVLLTSTFLVNQLKIAYYLRNIAFSNVLLNQLRGVFWRTGEFKNRFFKLK